MITKTRILRQFVRLLTWPRILANKLDAQIQKELCTTDATARLLEGTVIANALEAKDRIQIGAHTVSRGEGSIRIGSHCYVGDHSRIWSAVGIQIGDRVLISHGVNIHDHSAHPIAANSRHIQAVNILAGTCMDMSSVDMAPITIHDDVWLGFNAIVLKGVTIGRGAIIGAATVITKDVPEFAIMVGNPARQVGTASE